MIYQRIPLHTYVLYLFIESKNFLKINFDLGHLLTIRTSRMYDIVINISIIILNSQNQKRIEANSAKQQQLLKKTNIN